MSKPHINVTPLIDVLLVLLIIFMVVTPMKPGSFDARIPSEPDQDSIVEPDPRTLVVTVTADSRLFLNREDQKATVADPKNLIDRLAQVFKQREENEDGDVSRVLKTVFIKAPRALDYGSVAKVVDAVKQAGARPVSLQIDELE